VSAFHHKAPHGGTLVALGDGDYHLELVRDPEAGTLSAYVLDDDVEEFVRIPDRELVLVVTVGGVPRPLVLSAVANPATGETVGDTALFQGRADWLRTSARFGVRLRRISVHGTAFPDVGFEFPAGNDAQ
jgi:hypothetical protein